MQPYTITELSYSIIAISGAISGILLVIWKSRCKTINCCWGGIQCDRDVIEEYNNHRSNQVTNGEAHL